MRELLDHADVRRRARSVLPRFMFEYVDRGAEDELAIVENRSAFDKLKLKQRILMDVSQRDASVELFGRRFAVPVGIAPTASASMVWHNGEHALARAAASANVPFCLSAASALPVEEAANLGGAVWFQAYALQDEATLLAVLKRVEAAGVDVLILTVDTPVFAIRRYNQRNGFNIPPTMNLRTVLDALSHPAWLTRVLLRYALTTGLPRFANLTTDSNATVADRPKSMAISPAFDWQAFAKIRRAWKRPLVIKGVMTTEDANLSVMHGADGIIISNHGGRNLDSAPATLQVLPRIADTVAGRIPVLMDGGILHGSDVVKALASGADAVLCGKLALYGCASGGERGVSHVLAMLREEIDVTMAFVGCTALSDITRTSIEARNICDEDRKPTPVNLKG